MFQFISRLAATVGSAPPPNDSTVTEDTGKPSEKRPDLDGFKVAADQPKMIHLPQINATGPIQRVGLNQQNAIAVPTNINFAGWYTGSSKPGHPGLSVIDGHVSGRYGPGIFKNLSQLDRGDHFQVEYGDGFRRTFEVVESKSLREKDASAYLLQKRSDIARQLNLITCEGRFNRQSGQYDERLVVVSKALDE